MSLSASPLPAPPDLPLPGGISPGLARGRVHEVCGPARMALALMLLGAADGAVIWVMPAWLPERPYPCGVRDYLHPGRLIFARARRPEDIQWVGEEALRSGAAPMVVLEMPSPPGLTPVRRLHLAATAGRAAAHHAARPAPLGLILLAEGGGAQGVESRWHMASAPAPSGLLDSGGACWHLTRTRARTAPVASWHLHRDRGGQITAGPAQPPHSPLAPPPALR